MKSIKYWQAINTALEDSLAEDDRVCLYGEDVGAPGGPFGASKGLQEKFGAKRVRDTPISEAAIVGTAVGAAMTGLRPIVEIMFMDFLGLAMDQLVNQAAKVAYMSGGAYHVPMVVRTLSGAGRNTGPQHSQTFEGWLAGVPGLKVAWSTTPSDAYGLLRTAVRDDDPVILIESLNLWTTRESVTSLDPVPLGRASIRRPGKDVTVVSWGSAVHRAIAAAERFSTEGIGVRVIDLRWLSPLDVDAVLTAVEETGRLVIVADSPGDSGIAARIASLAASEGFASLRAPVRVVTAPFAPVPFPPALESAYFPSVESIAIEIQRVMES